MEGDFRVGEWLVQPKVGTITKGDHDISLEPKVMEVLVYLAQHTDDVLPKKRIIQAVWGDTFVTDDALKDAIVALRKALDDDSHSPTYIETIPRRGYRLIAPMVAEVQPADSRYRVLEAIGEGAMGKVFLGEDQLLKRRVALKFLIEELSEDETARKRFVREARAAAALDHPFICSVHDTGELEGRTFIAMEFMEGQTLKERIAQGPLPLSEALKVASEVAEALEKAHTAGIVHRDLKPANIMLTPDGHAKVMDFGLAKQVFTEDEGSEGFSSTLTREGAVVGTLSYLSPEQVRGETVDHRTDLFSFGVVLYEMVTGKKPFTGPTPGVILGEILHKNPVSPIEVNPGLPAKLEDIINRCIVKDRERRIQSVKEVLTQLRGLRRDIDAGLPAHLDRKPGRSERSIRWWPAALVGAVLLFGLVIIVQNVRQFLQSPSDSTSEPVHRQITFTGNALKPAISPNGEFVAYVSAEESGHQLLVQDLSGGAPLTIADEQDREIQCVDWSPSGKGILFSTYPTFQRGGGLFIIPRLGGERRRVGDAVYSARWSPDGTHIATATLGQSGFTIIDLSTRRSETVSLDGFQWNYGFDWSVEDKLLFMAQLANGISVIWTVNLDGTELARLYEHEEIQGLPQWSSSGREVYFFDFKVKEGLSDLLKIPLSNSAESTLTKRPEVLASGFFTIGNFSVSADNRRMAYDRLFHRTNLFMMDLSGSSDGPERLTPLTKGTADCIAPSISPDEKWVAFVRREGYASNIYKMSIQGGVATQLTYFEARCMSPAWSPDGSQIAFGSNQGGSAKVWVVGADGGPPRQFTQTSLSPNTLSVTWSPGTRIIYRRPGHRNYVFLDPETEEEEPLIQDDSVRFTFGPVYSPDGRRVAVVCDCPPEKPGLWTVSVEDGTKSFLGEYEARPLAWSSDGNWLFAQSRSPSGQPIPLMKIPAQGGTAETLFFLPADAYGWSTTRDVKKIAVQVEEFVSDVWLMEGFDTETAD